MIALAFTLAATTAPWLDEVGPGQVRLFGDWAVGCDNAQSCEALSVASENFEAGGSAALSLTRTAGSGEMRLAALVMEDVAVLTVSLRVDGRPAGSATRTNDGTGYAFDVIVARAVTIPMIVAGRSATLHDEGGALLDTISLTGSSAALRFIDEAQGRAGRRGALVAQGDAPDTTSAPALPVVRQHPVAARAQEVPSALPEAEARQLHEERECDGFDDFPMRNEAIALDDASDLILISCSRGAYNFSDIAFVRDDDGLRPARFDRVFHWGDSNEVPWLVNAVWDEESGQLWTHAKGRGIGDCGTGERFVWDGAMFRLIERREMNDCRGAFHWITVWRARVEVVEP